MDVDKVAFLPRLLGILEALSQAHFVAIDFELSGVPGRSERGGEQTLEARYQELREAAARYQILQIGITTAKQDSRKETYTLRAYNIPLNPCIKEENLGIERIFSFQSGAVDFLMKNGFDFQVPFEHGVPYLSRDEEEQAKQKFRDRNDRSKFSDIVLGENDAEARKFMDKVRKEVDEWLKTGRPDEDSFSITSRNLPSTGGAFPELQSFDRRLLHQVIRAEYPQLTTQGRYLAVTIRRLDESREKWFQKERKKKSRAQIARQIGFRWVVEAMTGGKLDKIELEWFAKDPVTGIDVFYDKEDYSSRFNRAAAILKMRRPVLVGHNCFTDLVYFYQCFIGTLPQKVEDFARCIHELFPTVVDTKYLATHNCGSLNPASSLQEIEEELRKETVPKIVVHPDHDKYHNRESYHEAGYDSYLTARIMILLSAQLEASGTYVPDIIRDSSPSVTILSDEDAGFHSAREFQSPWNSPQKRKGKMLTMNGGVTLPFTAPPILGGSPKKEKPSRSKVKGKTSPAAPKTLFASKTAYEALASLNIDDEEEDAEDEETTAPTESAEQSINPATLHPNSSLSSASIGLNLSERSFSAPAEHIKKTKAVAVAAPGANATGVKTKDVTEPKKRPDGLMPPFNSDFWRVYANRLRVFGTEERFLELDLQRRL